MKMDLLIRPATPADAWPAIELLQQALSDFGDHVFGNGDREKSRSILQRLFVAGENRFNFRHTFLAEKEDRVVGLLLAFSSNLMRRLDLLTGRHLLNILQPVEILKLLMRILPHASGREANRDEYYISDLAVDPGFQGQHIGSRLLKFAEAQAILNGLKKCSLIVTHQNKAALRLYTRFGYSITGLVKIPSRGEDQGNMGFYRMVKPVKRIA